jgi:uncharacterized membrane protein
MTRFRDNIVIALVLLTIVAVVFFLFLIELLLAIILAFSIGLTIGDWFVGMCIVDCVVFVILCQKLPNKIADIIFKTKKAKRKVNKQYSSEEET